MSGNPEFLTDKVAGHDLVMVHVMSASQPQTFRAIVERIYSARKGINATCLGSEIEFVSCPNHWGQVTLTVGDRALLFVKLTAGRFYEDAWRGHMVVEEIEGDLYAVIQHRELWLNGNIPQSIRAFARQDPKRTYATAVRFDALEAYLLDMIKKTDGGVL